MAVDPVLALHTEMIAIRDAFMMQIRGLTDLAKTPLSTEAINAVNGELKKRTRWLDLVLAVLTGSEALAALVADGYPNLPKAGVPVDVFNEIQEENADMALAATLFDAIPLAAKITVSLGAPTAKPNH